MRKLTTREKTMIGLCGVVVIVALGLFIFRPLLNQWRSAGEEIKLKQTELKSAQELVNFGSSAIAIEDKLRVKTGLESSIISDEQFKKLKEQLDVGNADDGSNKLNINKVTRTELTNLGLDKYLINSILAYRDKVGQFKELEELKNIRGTIFEEQLAEAIITQRLAKIIQDAGINRIDRLDPKPVSGKKTETISRDVKNLFIDELYLNELETEMQSLEKSEGRQEGKKARRQGQKDHESLKGRQFEPLPDVIPDELKIDVVKAIIAHKGEIKQKFIEQEGATKEEAVQLALHKLKAKEEDVYVKVLDKGRKGFLGFLAKPVKVSVTKKEDEQGIIAGFRKSLRKYNEKLASAPSSEENFSDDDYYGDENYDGEIEQSVSDEGESSKSGSDEIAKVEGSETPGAEKAVDESRIEKDRKPKSSVNPSLRSRVNFANTNGEDVIISKLAEYLVKVSQKKDEIQDWLYDVPISYQKQSYVVDISFKCEMGQLVNVMYKIESSLRWLSVRDLKISIADQEKTLLSANMSVLATVL
jgi:predicted RNA-binding protein Jag/DNA uptake protein ComE-like DNA-binding protein